MAAAEEESSLKDVFEQGFLLHCQIEDSDEPSSSEAFQVVSYMYVNIIRIPILKMSKNGNENVKLLKTCTSFQLFNSKPSGYSYGARTSRCICY